MVTVTGRATVDGVVMMATATLTVASSPAALAVGANYDSAAATDQSKYAGRAKVARLYLSGGTLRSDIKTEPNFAAAYAAGVRSFVVSYKTINHTLLGQMLDSFPAGCTVYVAHWHEVEDDIRDGTVSLAAWKAEVTAASAIVHARGQIMAQIHMSYSLNPNSGRNIADYKMPAGIVDVAGFDYYPKRQAITQAQAQANMLAGRNALGLTRLLIGEYGVPTTGTDSVQLITDFKTWLTSIGAEAACYWSNDIQVFSTATANAWFA